MGEIFSVYCDESCHLQNDSEGVMVLGAVWCPTNQVNRLNKELRDIKLKFGIAKNFEIKWNKISPGQEDFYLELVKFFFDNPLLHFRGLIVSDKAALTHDKFGHDHDTWYFKMYFNMLRAILDPQNKYRVFLDIKDTRSAERVRKLHEVLNNDKYDFNKQIVESMQTVRSHEVQLIQMADLFIGALAYHLRGLNTSTTKLKLVNAIKEKAGISLSRSTLYRESKFNIFVWQGQRNGSSV
jgi:hypothetical protein